MTVDQHMERVLVIAININNVELPKTRFKTLPFILGLSLCSHQRGSKKMA